VTTLLICPTKAPPFLNQADLIAKLAKEKGHRVKLVDYISLRELKDEENDAFLWITLGCKEFLGEVLWPAIYARDYLPKKRLLAYCTIEGRPTGLVHNPNYQYIPVVAVSEFAYDNIKKSIPTIMGYVHHGIDTKVCDRVYKSKAMKKKLDEKYGDRVKFLFVARDDPRKGIDKLRNALDLVNEKCKEDFVLLLISTKKVEEYLKADNVVLVETFGTKPYLTILRYMAAVDYGMFPSQLEGFGLPLLEFNAVGTPVLHCWIPPLTEFSSEEFNFVWDWIDRYPVKCSHSQEWLFFDYLEEDLAQAWMDAIRIFKESKEEYEEYCQKAKEHAKRWDYHNVYPTLLSFLGL